MRKYLEYFAGSFDSTVVDKMKLENKPYVAYSKTAGVIYTIVPKEEKDMWIISTIELKDISNCTYNMVDLGLPSGLKWADRNVGASSPEHYGSYFQWGDTNAYNIESSEITTEQLVNILNPLMGPEVTVDNVKDILASQGVTGNDLRDSMKAASIDAVSINKEFNSNSYFDTTDGGSTFNKYNNNVGLTVLESSDDAAAFHMGTQYRMPTRAEIQELISGTTQSFIDIDGNEYDRQYAYDNEPIERGKLKGVKFTGSNGNSIFIPAAGYCDEFLLCEVGVDGILWSSCLDDGYAMATSLGFGYVGRVGEYGGSRDCGRSVRGVQA
jgi:hypothetical protein